MKRLPLTQGLFALVDDEDYEWARQFNWCAARVGTYGVYAQRRVPLGDGRQTTAYLHREITRAPRGRQVDHVNGDTLDDRRANLRLVTQAQNLQNRRNLPTTATGVRNVYRERGRYRVILEVAGRRVNVGCFSSLEEATLAASEARRQHFTHAREI